jgi:hypothetical protein
MAATFLSPVVKLKRKISQENDNHLGILQDKEGRVTFEQNVR